MQYRIAIVAAIDDKSHCLNSASVAEQSSTIRSDGEEKVPTRGASSAGRIVNMATNDVE